MSADAAVEPAEVDDPRPWVVVFPAPKFEWPERTQTRVMAVVVFAVFGIVAGLIVGSEVHYLAGLGVAMGTIALVIVHVIITRMAVHRRVHAALLAEGPGTTLADAARHATARSGLSRMRDGFLDAPWWFARARELCAAEARALPIVLSRHDVVLPRVRDLPAEIHEPVQVGSGRPIREAERKNLIRGVLMGLPSMIMWMLIMRWWWIGAMFFVGGVALPLWSVLKRSGVLPLDIESTIAEPGLVSRAVWGRVREFTPRDSVLVLTPKISTSKAAGPSDEGRYLGAGAGIRAVLCREDGKRAVLWFTDCRDPGLLELLARWTAGWGGKV